MDDTVYPFNPERPDEWVEYRKKATTPMRPYIPGEDLTHISVGEGVTPVEGGMIARDHNNIIDQWYISPDYLKATYEEVTDV